MYKNVFLLDQQQKEMGIEMEKRKMFYITEARLIHTQVTVL